MSNIGCGALAGTHASPAECRLLGPNRPTRREGQRKF